MRLFLAGLLVISAAFLLGRSANPDVATGAASSAVHVYTGHNGDVFRAPGAAFRCEVRTKAVWCDHTPFAHEKYRVVFHTGNLAVIQLGKAHNPVFYARWRP